MIPRMARWSAPFLAGLVLSGCLASSVIERDARAVAAPEEQGDWTPLEPAALPGLWASESIDGAAAAVVREVHYWFGEDGRFSGAALCLQPEPAYQVLEGRWTLVDGELTLGAGSVPARAEVAGERLRLSGEEGTVLLSRVGVP